MSEAFVLTDEQRAAALFRAVRRYENEGVQVVPTIWSQRLGRFVPLESEDVRPADLGRYRDQLARLRENGDL